MKPKVLAAGAKFVQKHQKAKVEFEAASRELESFLERVLASHLGDLHGVSARPKDEASLREKILRKGYTRPGSQVTDVLGGRVVVLFSDRVDAITKTLRLHLEIDERKSIDKRSVLGGAEFGYRSVHLVGRTSVSWRRQFSTLGSRKFEVQVRSLLEHAWSEIEHEVIYKSGSRPAERIREFASLAGMLELVDNKFCEAREAEGKEIEAYRKEFELGQHAGEALDGVRMLAILGLRNRGPALPRRYTQVALRLLEAAKVKTTTELDVELERAWFKKAVGRYCASQTPVLAPSELPQLTVIAIIAKEYAASTLAFALPELGL